MAPAYSKPQWKGRDFKDAPHVKPIDMEIGGTAAVDIAKHESKTVLKAVVTWIEQRKKGKVVPPATADASKFLWRAYSIHPDFKPPPSVTEGMGNEGPKRTTEKKKSVFPIGPPQMVEQSLLSWKKLVPEIDLPTLQLIMEHVFWQGVYTVQDEPCKVEAIERSLRHWLEQIERTWRENNSDLCDNPLDDFTNGDSLFRVGIPRPTGAAIGDLRILWDLEPTDTDSAELDDATRKKSSGQAADAASRPKAGSKSSGKPPASGGQAVYRERGFNDTLLGSGSPPAGASGRVPATTPPSAASVTAASDPTVTPPTKCSRVSASHGTDDGMDDGSYADAMQELFGNGNASTTPDAGSTQGPASQAPLQAPAPAQQNFLVRVVKGTVGAVGQALVDASR